MEDKKRIVRVTIDTTGNQDLLDVDVDTETGDVRFRLRDGFLYDSKKKNLCFGETDPVMQSRLNEAILLSLMVGQQHPEVFKNARISSHESRDTDWQDMTLIIK